MSDIVSLLTPNVKIIGETKTLKTLLNEKQSYSDALTDIVALTGEGLLKRYNDGSWALVVGGGGGASTLNDLTDVTISSLSTGQLLRYSGTEWVNWTPTYLTGNQTITLSGDASGSGSTSISVTLATVNSNVGTFGSATAAPSITVNGKGLVTAVTTNTITPAIGSVTGLGTGIATFLGTPSSANLASAITDETGTGALVFANTPTLVTPILGTPTSGTLTNCTGYTFANIASKPTTLSGYGITDALNLSGGTLTGTLILPAATTSIPSLRMPHGSAPTSPTNGDVWTTTAGMYARINGSTVGPFSAGSSTSEHPGAIQGSWYQFIRGSLGPGSALVTNSIRLIPFYVPSDMTIANFGARITTASSGNNIQLAIYNADSTYGTPTGSAVAATANISTTSTGLVSATKSGGGTFALTKGWYWMAVNSNNSVVVMQTLTGAHPQSPWAFGASAQAAASGGDSLGNYILSYSQTFGTWPDLTAASFTEETTSSGIGASCVIHFKTNGVRPVP